MSIRKSHARRIRHGIDCGRQFIRYLTDPDISPEIFQKVKRVQELSMGKDQLAWTAYDRTRMREKERYEYAKNHPDPGSSGVRQDRSVEGLGEPGSGEPSSG